MKKYLLLLVFVLNSIILGQTIAVTENGDTVLLSNDGTWEFYTKYTQFDGSYQKTLDTNSTHFTKPENSTKVLKGQKTKYQVWYDVDTWEMGNKISDDAEYVLTSHNSEIYFITIPERVELDIEALKSVALGNAKGAGKNFKLLEEEVRKVNNTYVHMLKFRAKIQNMDFIYMGYYYTAENISIQLLTFTFAKFFDDYEKDMLNVLNGFVP